MKRTYFILGLLVVLLVILYLGIDFFSLRPYIQESRIIKLLAYLIIVILLIPSTIVFQTIVSSKFLSPSILGMDSFYVFIQSVFFFFIFRVTGSPSLSPLANYCLNIGSMIILFFLLFSKIKVNQLHRLNQGIWLMVGLVLGNILRSSATFFQVLMDPNEYLQLQSRLIPSFQSVEQSLLWVGGILSLVGFGYFISKRYVLDVYQLGPQTAVGLGIQVDREVKRLLFVVTVMVASATAIVGPLTFIGFLVANLTYRLVKDYRHGHMFWTGVLLGCSVLILGQFIMERILNYQMSLSILLEGFGGFAFFLLLFRKEQYR